MAVISVTGNPVVGVKYSVTTANSADWASVSNNTYFFDLTDRIVYYKDSIGVIINPFINSNTGSGSILAITELTAPTLATYTVPSSTLFTAVNLNSDSTNRFAKVVFTAPIGGIVLIELNADIVFLNSAAVMMVGLNSTSTSTTTPDNGWFRINGDADGSSSAYYASFIINGLTEGVIYTYYLMSVCNFSGNLIRCGSQQSGAYVSGADRPSPMRISVTEIASSTTITTNPSS